MRAFGIFTIANGVVATVAACVIWAVAGLWWLIPVFVVLGAGVVVLGRLVMKRGG